MLTDVVLMTADEVENRLGEGEKTIDLSIEKWERIVEAYANKIDKHIILDNARSALNCALCSKFHLVARCSDKCPLNYSGNKCRDSDSIFMKHTANPCKKTAEKILYTLYELKKKATEDDDEEDDEEEESECDWCGCTHEKHGGGDCYHCPKCEGEGGYVNPMMRFQLTWFKSSGKYYTGEMIDLSDKFKAGDDIHDMWDYIDKNHNTNSLPYCLVELMDEHIDGPSQVPKLLIKEVSK